MTNYIASIISAAVLSGAASLLSPQSWRKYVGMITGIVILCTIIAPLSRIDAADIFHVMNDTKAETAQGEELRLDMIRSELTDRVNGDIERRMKDEFGASISAAAEIGVSAEGKITGVSSITIEGKLSEAAKQRLCEVYGVEKVTIKGRG